MNPIHSKSLTYKLEFIPFFTTGRLISSLFLSAIEKILESISFNAYCKISTFGRKYVHLRNEESLERNMILAFPVVGQIITICDELLIRASSTYLIMRSDYGSSLETLEYPLTERQRNDPDVIKAAIALHMGRQAPFWSSIKETDWPHSPPPFFIHAGKQIRRDKNFILELINNPISLITAPSQSGMQHPLEFSDNYKGSDKITLPATTDMLTLALRARPKLGLSTYASRYSVEEICATRYFNLLTLLFVGMDESLQNDKAFAVNFLDKNPLMYNRLSPALKADPEIIKIVKNHLDGHNIPEWLQSTYPQTTE